VLCNQYQRKIDMKLLEPIELQGLQLKNRMVMAAMTRSRASADGIVGDLTATYYAQRASAGLIISEAINISQQAIGSPFTPGLFSPAQIAAWQQVTKAVHEKGGLIFAQLWHTGRVGHSVDRGGALPVAPSAIAITGMQHFTSQGPKDFETPLALTTAEIRAIVKDYGRAATAAMEAGFDGVELHAANGYLPNQFLAESANHRTDEYGGSIENNCRFTLEVMHELIGAIGGQRVGIKISPFQAYAGIRMDDPLKTFSQLIAALNEMPILFVELMKRSPMFPLHAHYPGADELELFGKQVAHPLIINTGYTRASAEEVIASKAATLVSFGSLFLANPDLVRRFAVDAELNSPDPATMFGGGAKGYTDYPTL
jgi:N-ethylmaleimide reductase